MNGGNYNDMVSNEWNHDLTRLWRYISGALLAANGISLETSHVEKASTLAAQIRTLQDILRRFTGLRVDATEYACLKALVLFKSGECSIRFEKKK